MPIDVPDRRCSFCDNFIGLDPPHGPPAVVYEDDAVYVFLAPASLGGMKGHTLVASRRHVPTILDLTDAEVVVLARTVKRAASAVTAAFDPEGVLVEQRNGMTAGQGVPHIHFHVIPRRWGTQYPPSVIIEVTPADERATQAQELRRHW